MKSGQLWDNMRKYVNIIDDLRDTGVADHISLPRICVLGMQSAGKSSLLENVVGLDFLPRGEGLVTRRPLEMRLVHTQHIPQPWATFKEVPGKKFYDFNEVRQTIDDLTDKMAGQRKNIIDFPIELTIYSPDAPDLTMIDLPGITLIPLKDSDQDQSIEKVTKDICRKYCQDERTIILCVMPATQDLSVQHSLKMALELDPNGQRTIGVLTKIDIMGEGSDVEKLLLNSEIKFQLGLVGVKNRSQADIKNKVPVAQALENELQYFTQNPKFSHIPQDVLGTKSLVEKLTSQMYQHIRKSLPQIMEEIDRKQDECEDRLKRLGPSLPQDHKDKIQIVYNLLKEYTDGFKNTMDGKYDKNEFKDRKDDDPSEIQLTGGAKIKKMFAELYKDESKSDYKVCNDYSDSEILKADELHQGDTIPGFPSFDSFLYLIVPKVQDLMTPAQEILDEIFTYMDEISQNILTKVFMRFPMILEEVSDLSRKVIEAQRNKAEQVVRNQLDSEMHYIFTNDEDYMTTKTDLKFKQKGSVNPKDVLVRELRTRVDFYYRILIRNLRDSIPKYIGYYLVKQSLDKMQYTLYEQINKSDTIFQQLEEPAYITQEREQLIKTLAVLKKALKVLRSDPDLSTRRN